MARRLDITPSQISRLVNAETKTISSDILIKLAREFGVSTDYILGLQEYGITNENKSTDDKAEELNSEHNKSSVAGENSINKVRTPMILMSSAFECGKCLEFIESLEDEEFRQLREHSCRHGSVFERSGFAGVPANRRRSVGRNAIYFNNNVKSPFPLKYKVNGHRNMPTFFMKWTMADFVDYYIFFENIGIGEFFG